MWSYARKAKHIKLKLLTNVVYLHSRETSSAVDCVFLCVDSDSEMEIEAEHYSNGVTESSTRIMNGTYKHQEILQADDSSVGNGVAGTGHAHTPHTVCRTFNIVSNRLWESLLKMFLLIPRSFFTLVLSLLSLSFSPLRAAKLSFSIIQPIKCFSLRSQRERVISCSCKVFVECFL